MVRMFGLESSVAVVICCIFDGTEDDTDPSASTVQKGIL